MTSQRSATRLLCVDDHAFMAEGLKAQFSVTGGGAEFQVVGHLTSAQGLIKEVRRLQPDVILLDIEMPGPDSFEMADRLHRLDKNVRIVFLSAFVRDHYIAAAYRSGARGYFSKADEIDHIIDGLRRIVREDGEFVMGPKVKQRCRPPKEPPTHSNDPAVKSDPEPATRLATLTTRELEVLRLIGKGMSRHEIAAALSRSAKTIDGHQERILKKLGIDTRAEVMRFAIREGLVEA